MPTNASAICKFSDGSVVYMRNDITLDAATELLSDASGLVNQAGGLSLGQIAQGRLLTHCGIKIQTDDATTGAFSYGSLSGIGGNLIGLVQGGGTNAQGLPALKRPVRMMTGIKLNVFAQAVANAVQIATVAVYTRSGKVDVFQGTVVDATDVSMTSVISGSTLGEALVNQNVLCYYATYPATNGLADDGVVAGVNALYVESATGQLKSMMYITKGTGDIMTQFVDETFSIVQNDTLTARGNV